MKVNCFVQFLRYLAGVSITTRCIFFEAFLYSPPGFQGGCLEPLSWGTLLFCADPARLQAPALGLAPVLAEPQGLQGSKCLFFPCN